ncbi:sulfurtransferase [Streptosporangium jomthongense]|uniref:Rhodanese-like domain-containing protein n=1 Tax=Marinobacter aromaticivorans TaxID=1494078 RepID=A0ABW2IVM7_9GAMM|nr:rhodanese-like domain-containing protein [Marinobacter aromaticivorans]GGE65563.1 sulfurtransferase [Streptosporangium jomthongense]
MKTAQDFVAEAKQHIQEIPLEEADSAIQAADLLLDVRDADEYRHSHIPQATNVSRGLLEFKFSNDPTLADRNMNIVLYCKNSGRSALCAKVLQDMGYLHVQSIEGGFDAWQEAGKPVAEPKLPPFG